MGLTKLYIASICNFIKYSENPNIHLENAAQCILPL